MYEAFLSAAGLLALSLGAQEILILVVAGFVLLPWLYHRRRKPGSESIFRAVGVTVVVCVGLALVPAIYFVHSQNRQTLDGPVNVSDVVVQADSTNASVEPVLASFAGPAPVAVPQAEADEGTQPLHSADGNVMWLPLSDDVIATILTPDGAAAVAKLNESLPPELRQAYAMIPLSPRGPQAAPSVLDHALASSIVREALTPQNVRSAVTGLLQFLAVEGAPSQAPTPEFVALKNDYEAPEWIENPGSGLTVVKSEFQESEISVEQALRPEIQEMLRQRVAALTVEEFPHDGKWNQLIDVVLSDTAVSQCIVETDARTEILPTVDGPKQMRRTTALIEIPEAVETQVLTAVRTARKQDRAIALCIVAGVLWLSSVLLSIMFRVSQRGSFLSKLATVPALSLLVLPCLIIAIAMSTAMINGKTLSFRWTGERITCAVDDIER